MLIRVVSFPVSFSHELPWQPHLVQMFQHCLSSPAAQPFSFLIMVPSDKEIERN
jgi:hypothetical protein